MEMHTEMVNMLGESVQKQWLGFQVFLKIGTKNFEILPWGAPRPKDASTPDTVAKIKEMVLENCRLIEDHLIEAMGISIGSVNSIVSWLWYLKAVYAKHTAFANNAITL